MTPMPTHEEDTERTFTFNIINSSPEKTTIEFIPSKKNVDIRKAMSKEEYIQEENNIFTILGNAFNMSQTLQEIRESILQFAIDDNRKRNPISWYKNWIYKIDDTLELMGIPRLISSPILKLPTPKNNTENIITQTKRNKITKSP